MQLFDKSICSELGEISNTDLIKECCSIILVPKEHVHLRLKMENGEELKAVNAHSVQLSTDERVQFESQPEFQNGINEPQERFLFESQPEFRNSHNEPQIREEVKM